MTALVTEAPLEAFLAAAPLIEVDAPEIGAFVATQLNGLYEADAARTVFLFVRDEVHHSWDVQGRRVTRSAVDTLTHREGICYAKSHLAAALLRRAGLPAGICYQRLTLFDDASGGHAVHALNTVYLGSLKRWIRFDARGNKPGVDAQFSLEEERLAFAIRPEHGEIDYLRNHPEPHPAIVRTLVENDDALVMYRERLPEVLE
jgi:transglutaminase-like putative cysteine protease